MKVKLDISTREIAIGLIAAKQDFRFASFIASEASNDFAKALNALPEDKRELTVEGVFGKFSKDNQTALSFSGKSGKVASTPAIFWARFGQKIAKDLESLKKEFGVEFGSTFFIKTESLPKLAMEWLVENKISALERLIADCGSNKELAEKRKKLEAEIAELEEEEEEEEEEGVEA